MNNVIQLKTKTNLRVITLDIIGNNHEGYEVNDAYSSTYLVEDSHNKTDREIITDLKRQGFINKKSNFKSFVFDWSDDNYADIYYNTTKLNMYPIAQLILEL